MKSSGNKTKVGILGGGQLARMMLLQGHRLGMNCQVLCSDKREPAAQVCSQFTQGNIQSEKEVLKFAKKVDVLTFESEFVKPEVLNALKKNKVKTYPHVKHMLMLQDRLPQKKLLEKYDVPTSPFWKVDQYNDLLALKERVKLPLVLKARRDGYDGKGTLVLKTWDDPQAIEFYKKNTLGVIAEMFIPFKRELAISLVRNKKGEVAIYPLVESFQEDCRCLWVKGPIQHPKISRLLSRLKKLLVAEKYIGFISFEIFDTGEKLIINEIAPRVHNSAHYSQDGLSEDQFSSHLKAVVGETLKSPKPLTGGFAMYNLIGEGTLTPKWNFKAGIFFHWYGKVDNRIGRKMGHLNAVGSSPEQALKKLKKARKDIKL